MANRYCFHIFVSNGKGPLSLQLKNLENQLIIWMMEQSLSVEGLLVSRIYLTDAANQWGEIQKSSLYVDLLSRGAVSFIEQPLLCGAKVALQVCFSKNDQVEKHGNASCMTIRDGKLFMAFQSVRFEADEVEGLDSEEQTVLAFNRHIDFLKGLGMTLEQNCHRTWIYVRDIDKHYAGVVSGRNRIFEQNGLTADNHYIASTGIGGYSDNNQAIVSVDFFSLSGVSDDAVSYLHALDYLNPTHEYGVAFERGTKIQFDDFGLCLISGTASIDKNGNCLHVGDVLTQTGRLFLNIEKLLEDGNSTLKNIQYFIVYLRDIADYESVDRYMKLRFPNVPYLITEARVCRPEWLIEVEGIAIC